MAARKFGLMLKAYLRGLLEPYYDRGLSSVLRERVVLQAISNEGVADSMQQRLLIDASFSNHYGENVTRVINELYKAVERIRGYSEFDSGVDKLPVVTDAMKALAELYESLSDAGMMEPEPYDE